MKTCRKMSLPVSVSSFSTEIRDCAGVRRVAFPSIDNCCFSGKVRLYSILMEDVRELKEFVVKHCRVVCFSGGGQYFCFAHNAQVREQAAVD